MVLTRNSMEVGPTTVWATVVDSTGSSGKKPEQIPLSPTVSVGAIFTAVGHLFDFAPDVFELALQQSNGDVFVLNEHKHKTFGEVEGLNLSGRLSIALSYLARHKLSQAVTAAHKKQNHHQQPQQQQQEQQQQPDNRDGGNLEDDLLLGASASPTIGVRPTTSGAGEVTCLALMNVDFGPKQQQQREAGPRLHLKPEPCNYVGLVNQAMTCYLNSLLQALFMTPEFRNALYNWEFDGQHQEKSIPFQLQKLFLNLQTSTKSAVETTDLTHSFGWDLQAAWEQHDIQELCRVMFDALEQTFKRTERASLINDLYEGRMLDYVKCLECGTEKSREDTFQDIPLPVRPFGSAVAYNSVEEALRGFVQPETLDGNNQYFCERCDRKCDAHKGLKFTKFPYLLTLHLKRFDFDYTTMHRIKLNDKVVFPEVLNLNSFVPNVISMLEDAAEVDREPLPVTRCDDCSTTDSGSALDDESCQGTDASSTANGQDDPTCQDDDEGIDVSSGGAHNHHHENEKNKAQEPKGPYLYELFSIMIHSGSASGGHYYAYIKDFQKGHWFCFNDQSVGRITEDDIQKTYGGGPPRGYYSGAYTSSTNAYMLMYRQIDPQRNSDAMTVDQFPPHIQKLLRQMREKEESDRLAKEKENDMFKLRIYCNHPVSNQLLDAKIFAFVENSLAEIASDAYDKFKLKGLANLEDCRLVAYNKLYDCIECSFDGDDPRFSDPAVKEYTNQAGDWFLEIRAPGREFESYRPGGVKMKAYVVHLESDEVSGPVNVRINAGETAGELKRRLADVFGGGLDGATLRVILETGSGDSCLLDEDDVAVKFDAGCGGYKLYAAGVKDDEEAGGKQEVIARMYKVIDLFVHIVNIDVVLPENDAGTLESLSIPSLDLNQNLDGLEMASGDLGLCAPQQNEMEVQNGDHSNSEEGSLSDCDITLTGDPPTDPECGQADSADLNSQAAVDYTIKPHHHAKNGYHDETQTTYYYKVISTHDVEPSPDQENVKCCARIMVDKRTTIGQLKRNLEPTVGVPVRYFKLYRQYPNQNVELTNLTETLSTSKDGERLLVKLGRVLRKNEMAGKVYMLNADSSEPFNYLFECVVANGQTVASLKREILLHAKKQHMLDIPYDRCRLRKKNWKNPSKVYLDDQKFTDDIAVSNKFEVILQELREPERLVAPDQLAVFVKRWSPSTLRLSNFDEVVLEEQTMDELKRRLAEKFDVPVEFVDVALLKSYFPCDMNVLEVDALEWNGDHVDAYSLQGREDACVFFFRDRREQLKELSPEERKDIQQRENARLGRFSSKGVFSPSRRERGLKIYLDAFPAKGDDGPAD